MSKLSPAAERGLFKYIAGLRRVKLTFNEDEIWVLYRLVVAERTDGTPRLLPDLPNELDHAMGTALAKLSSALTDLSAAGEVKADD